MVCQPEDDKRLNKGDEEEKVVAAFTAAGYSVFVRVGEDYVPQSTDLGVSQVSHLANTI